MWLEKLQEAKKMHKVTNKWISERTGYSERLISRLFAGEKKNPPAQLLKDVGDLFNLSLNQLLGDSTMLVGSEALTEMQAKVERLEIENARLIAENELLKIKLEHKEEIIALHNHYINVAKDKK